MKITNYLVQFAPLAQMAVQSCKGIYKMAEAGLFAGAALRRLRKREGLTQSAMAARLAISPSYLNLIERNQRPLSARVVLQVAEQFDFVLGIPADPLTAVAQLLK